MPLLLQLAAAIGLLTAGSETSAPDACTHVVESGDTLRRIAHRYSLSPGELMKLNPTLRDNPNLVRTGQTLEVCGGAKPKKAKSSSCSESVKHVVKPGETLDGLASRYGVSRREIVQRNRTLSADPDHLRAGDELEICTHPSRVRGAKACGYRTPLHRHEVVPGEHLGQIAGRYGVRRRDILRLNPGLAKDPGRLRVGQTVAVCPEIPPRARNRIGYEVRESDTLGEIAKRYDLTARELERYQQGNLENPNQLRVGQRLSIWVDGSVLPGFGGEEDRGVLRNGIQLPPSRNYTIKWDGSAWGTPTAVRAIQEAVTAYRGKYPRGPKVHVGDLSRARGGPFPPHVSHQYGRDADIGYVLTDENADDSKFHHASRKNLDVARTWALIRSFVDTDAVTYVFADYALQELLYEYAKKHGYNEDALDELFQFPRGRHRNHGIIRHEDGHTTHFHVRFRR